MTNKWNVLFLGFAMALGMSACDKEKNGAGSNAVSSAALRKGFAGAQKLPASAQPGDAYICNQYNLAGKKSAAKTKQAIATLKRLNPGLTNTPCDTTDAVAVCSISSRGDGGAAGFMVVANMYYYGMDPEGMEPGCRVGAGLGGVATGTFTRLK